METDRQRLYDLLGGKQKGDGRPLVAIKPDGERPPFFCVHAILGSVFPYHQLALHLSADRPFYGLEAKGLDGKERPRESIEAMAMAYIEAIKSVRPNGPYHLGGYSFGGFVAYEMARRLLAAGDAVGILAVFGVGAPVPKSSPMAETAKLFFDQLESARNLFENATLAELPPEQSAAWRAAFDATLSSPMSRVASANLWAQTRYFGEPIGRGLDLFVTRDQELAFAAEPSIGWRGLAGGEVHIHAAAGTHLDMFQPPHVASLGAKLEAQLRKAEP